jgi:hypothetical protein
MGYNESHKYYSAEQTAKMSWSETYVSSGNVYLAAATVAGTERETGTPRGAQPTVLAVFELLS